MSRALRPLMAPFAGLTILGIVLTGCTGASSPVATQAAAAAESSAAIRVVEPEVAMELLEAEPDRVVVDVRTPGEFVEGHLEGALLVDYNAPDFEQRIAELDRDDRYLIYCRSGNRSAGARQVMEQLGFTDVVDVGGGAIAWTQAGLPLTTG